MVNKVASWRKLPWSKKDAETEKDDHTPDGPDSYWKNGQIYRVAQLQQEKADVEKKLKKALSQIQDQRQSEREAEEKERGASETYLSTMRSLSRVTTENHELKVKLVAFEREGKADKMRLQSEVQVLYGKNESLGKSLEESKTYRKQQKSMVDRMLAANESQLKALNRDCFRLETNLRQMDHQRDELLSTNQSLIEHIEQLSLQCKTQDTREKELLLKLQRLITPNSLQLDRGFDSDSDYSEDEQPNSNKAKPRRLTDGGWDCWGKGSSHLELSTSESLPLDQGEFLGHGCHGPVHAASCVGQRVAWKRKYCRSRISKKEREEINILKKLRHRHVIRLIGTYTQGLCVGLLLYPVAVTDLWTFMEDLDSLQHPKPDHEDEKEATLERVNRLKRLGLHTEDVTISARKFLRGRMGCLARAVGYLHENRIRHKDLKPPNILLNANGLFLTDFGTASDVSMFSQSVTDGGDRGTPKYFSPESAAYAPSGRASDIFSLGCVMLEMIAICNGYSIQSLKELRPHLDGSFHANLNSILAWFDSVELTQADTFLLGEVRMMLQRRASSRPTIQHVEQRLQLVDLFFEKAGEYYYQKCCYKLIHSELPAVGNSTMKITFGNSYEGTTATGEHRWTFFLEPSYTAMIQRVYCFMHPSYPEPQRTLSEHPFEFSCSSLRPSTIGVIVLLKSGCKAESGFYNYYHGKEQAPIDFSATCTLSWELNLQDSLSSETIEIPFYNPYDQKKET